MSGLTDLEREYMRAHSAIMNSFNPTEKQWDEFKKVENELKELNAMTKPTEEQIHNAAHQQSEPITQWYMYNTKTPNMCYIWDISGRFIGSVTIDGSGAWTPHYQEGVNYLPINSALRLLGCPGAEDNTIE